MIDRAAQDERDMVRALGAEEWARRYAEKKRDDANWTKQTNVLLVSQGYRLANGGETGAHFEYLKIDDRPIDGGLCKLWVVKL